MSLRMCMDLCAFQMYIVRIRVHTHTQGTHRLDDMLCMVDVIAIGTLHIEEHGAHLKLDNSNPGPMLLHVQARL